MHRVRGGWRRCVHITVMNWLICNDQQTPNKLVTHRVAGLPQCRQLEHICARRAVVNSQRLGSERRTVVDDEAAVQVGPSLSRSLCVCFCVFAFSQAGFVSGNFTLFTKRWSPSPITTTAFRSSLRRNYCLWEAMLCRSSPRIVRKRSKCQPLNVAVAFHTHFCVY
jgi:hypothetical protein